MKLIGTGLAALLLIGGGVVALAVTGPEGVGAPQGSVLLGASQAADGGGLGQPLAPPQAGDAGGGGRRGAAESRPPGHEGQGREEPDGAGREGMREHRRELQRRTMQQAGITPAELLAARITALESMVSDGIIDSDRAERRIERMRAAAACVEGGGAVEECLGRGDRRGRNGGSMTDE